MGTDKQDTPAAKTWRVVQTIRESSDTTSVILEGPKETVSHRKAGQFASIRIMGPDGWSEPHPFTISCSPEEERLRFTIKNSGDFTARVKDWEIGAEVQCDGPYGAFCKDIDDKQDIVMIAGGVGITPFLSVLRHFRSTRATNSVLLFWGNKTLGDAFAAGELLAMTRELDLRVVHCLSREDPPPSPDGTVWHEKGRFTRELLEKYPVAETASFYVCGPAAMQESVLAALDSCGIGPDRVQKERFTS